MAQKDSILKEQEFEGKGLNFHLWVSLAKILAEHKSLMIKISVIMILLACSDTLMPLMNRYAIDHYLVEGNSLDSVPVFIGIYIILVIFQSFAVYLFFRFASQAECDFGANLRNKCFVKLQHLTYSYFDRTANGWLMARVTSDISRLADILAWSCVDLVWGFFVMIGISIVMLIVNWKMALAILIVVPFLWYVSVYFQRKILKAHRITRKINSTITASFAEGINGAKTTKVLAIEEDNQKEFVEKTNDMRFYSIRAARINAMFQPIVYLFSALVLGMLLTVGGNQVLLHVVEFGTLTMFINYANLFFDPLKQIARILAEFQMAQASAERILALLDEEIEITDSKEVIQTYGTLLEEKHENFEPIQGNVRFEHVDFYYKPEEIILKDFNLEVKQGQMIAFVGETGSGKSTIVNLLCRFYEPKAGHIYIDDKEYRERSVAWLHSQIGYVLQTPDLFSGTIKENIRYGRSDASDEEVIEVAKLIHAHGFIMRMEHGYDSEVGEGGARLSTGEKQLISFARAILANPAIVFLDEATSSIDTESEKAIQYAVKKLLENRTSFVVAHRLSTIVDADQIVCLQHGQIIEQGTHTELMNKKGYYYELYTSQSLKEQEQAGW